MKCPLCTKEDIIQVGKPLCFEEAVPFIRKEYQVVRCNTCQFYFVDPKIDLSITEWAQLYGKEYFWELNTWHQNQRLKDIQERLEKMAHKFENREIKFLDIGCGEGYSLIEGRKKNWICYGNDISDNRVQEAKDENIKFNLGDIFSAKYPKDFFDIVHMDSVLEHLTDPIDYLKELNRIMNKNGLIYIGVPNEDSLFDNFRQIAFKFIGKSEFSAKIKPFAPPFHVSGFTKKSLYKIAEITNFKVMEIKNFATHFEFMKYQFTSKSYWIHLMFLPLDVAAIPLKMEKYFAVYLKKE
jgi:SAM-dependent methyltransferase